jgi:IS30 family transposase
MGRSYQQLSLDDRCEIARLSANGSSVRQIAAALDRSASTISRELRRNHGAHVGYRSSYAHQQTRARRWKGSRLERQASLRAAVMERLASGCSPEQIAGRLAIEHGRKVISYESIYRFIYAQLARTKDYRWRRYLPRGKSKRGCRGRKGGSSASFIEGRVSVANRPVEASDRKTCGHWEADLMMFAKYGQAILTVHERKSRLLLAIRLTSKAAHGVARHLVNLFGACRRRCVRPSPSTTAPSSPAIACCMTWRSRPSSAIPMRPGRRAASRMPSDVCVASFPAKPISQRFQIDVSAASSPPITIPHENALTSKPLPRPSPKRCTSSVNPPPCVRRDDGLGLTPPPHTQDSARACGYTCAGRGLAT